MIVEYTKNKIVKQNTSIQDQIADAEYYFLIAKMQGSKASVAKWRRKLKQLKGVQL